MAIIKSYSPLQNLSNYGTFITDVNPNSDYFRITEFSETFTGGKNGFLIEGSEHLKETTEIKIEILDVAGNPIYYEPGNGVPEYYEGISKLVSVHVYEDTPIGIGKITILGELKTYEDANGVIRDIPIEWRGAYNVKWEKSFQINKNLTNETRVRFYKRPVISIDEIAKPIYNVTTPYITQSGSVEGISEIPIAGANLSRWTAGTLYKLKRTSGPAWTASIDENTITLPDLGYTATVKEVLNSDEILVNIPYTINNVVTNFTQSSYTSSFEYLDGQTFTESALTGSFAKINISNLKTFVGDVARVKIFRKSRNDVGDYVLVQESKLESTELLRDLTATGVTDISYGNFTTTNLNTYWSGSTNLQPIINLDKLYASVKPKDGQVGVQTLYTSQSVSVSKDVEYTLTFKTLYSGSVDNTKSLRAYLSSSTYTQDFLTLSGSAVYQTKQDITKNIIAIPTGSSADAKLVFEFNGSGWHVSNVSLRNAQETSFSPDEFTIVQDVSKNVSSETFDFRFEFYDINNNYIPVDVFATKQFTGGNNFPTSAKILLLQADKSAFRFTTGSIANPPFQQIGFTTTRQNIAGNVTYDRSVFDITGSYISPATYTSLGGVEYPGKLHASSSAGFIVQIDDFSGSLDTPGTPNLIRVGFITYTASGDGLEEYETIYRLEDGDNAPGLFASSTANQFIYKATDLSLNPSNQVITFDVRRKNLGITGTTITINSGSQNGIASPLTLLYDDPATAVATYYLSGSSFNYTSGSATYFFSASDAYGIDYHDTIKITPVKILDGISVILSNENATLPAKSTGFVDSGSFALTSGSVSVKVGGETINHSNGLTSNNTFDIISAVATNVQTGSLDYSTNNYYITRLDADSGSLNLTIRYKDGAGDTTDVTKLVTYTKAKRGVPNVIVSATPQSQVVTATSQSVQIGTLLPVSLTALEGSTTRFTSASVASADTNFTGTSITGQTLTLGTIPNGINAASASIKIFYTDSEGTYASQSIIVNATKALAGSSGSNGSNGTNGTNGTNGADGPGVVFRGPWDSTVTYYDTADYPTRRDAVLYNGTYYATIVNATTNLNKQPDTNPTFWESLGTDSYFVAAEIAIFRQSYVKETLNVGTNSSGNANITIAGGTTSPYISIGQSTKGYNQTGAWMGSDGTTGKLSLKSSTNSLLWDGTNLTITGGGTFSGALSAASGTFTGALSGGTISIGSGNSIFKADSNGIYLGNATFGSAPFRVNPDGVLTSTSGTIGGWTLGSSSLTGGNATLASSGNITLGTSNDVVRLSADDATYRLWIGNATAASAPFRVTKGGVLTATGVDITGIITATSGTFTGAVYASSGTFSGTVTATAGTIGGWTIGNSTIYVPNAITLDAGGGAGAKNITLYDTSNVGRVFIRQSSTFASLSGGSTTNGGLTTQNNTGTFSPGNFDRADSVTFTATSGLTFNISATFTEANGTNALTITSGTPYTIDCWSEIFLYNTTTGVYTSVLSYKDGITGGSSVTWAAINGKTAQISLIGDGNTYQIIQRFRWTYQGGTFYSASNYLHPSFTWSSSPANSFVEIIAGGIQVGRDTSNYVKMDRAAGSGTMLEVGGAITATGNITAFYSSDERLKENITPIENALDKIDKIEGVEFDWTDEFIERESGGKGEDNFHFRKHDVGVIAQEIQSVLPEVVAERPDGYLAVRYERIVPLLIQSIKELKKEIEDLKKNK